MHVGKTGGTTLRRNVLRFNCQMTKNKDKRQRCLNAFDKLHSQGHEAESVLSQRTLGITHHRISKPTAKEQTNFITDYLFTVREPIGRFESWFKSSSPHNCDYEKFGHSNEKCIVKSRAETKPNSFPLRFFYNCFHVVNDMALALDPNYYRMLETTKLPPNTTDCILL